ncbi:MAG: TetR/AcrR family transcriptional regulator [Deltaproteobacteria bacterium]|nr:TetR/AcrR family transcriptional regulator [Deltaproteobacteria bacterium]
MLRKKPKQSRSQATVNACLEATARVLEQEGLSGLTTNRVAEVAGVSIGSLYQYFPNKASLLLALAEHEAERDIDELKGHLACADSTTLKSLVQKRTELLGRRPQMRKILVEVEKMFGPSAGLQAARAAYIDLLASLSTTPLDTADRHGDAWLAYQTIETVTAAIAFDSKDRSEQTLRTESLLRLLSPMFATTHDPQLTAPVAVASAPRHADVSL